MTEQSKLESFYSGIISVYCVYTSLFYVALLTSGNPLLQANLFYAWAVAPVATALSFYAAVALALATVIVQLVAPQSRLFRGLLTLQLPATLFRAVFLAVAYSRGKAIAVDRFILVDAAYAVILVAIFLRPGRSAPFDLRFSFRGPKLALFVAIPAIQYVGFFYMNQSAKRINNDLELTRESKACLTLGTEKIYVPKGCELSTRYYKSRTSETLHAGYLFCEFQVENEEIVPPFSVWLVVEERAHPRTPDLDVQKLKPDQTVLIKESALLCTQRSNKSETEHETECKRYLASGYETVSYRTAQPLSTEQVQASLATYVAKPDCAHDIPLPPSQ